MDLKEQQVIGDDIEQHWYYCSKASAMVAYLNGINFEVIVDVGAGSGFFSRHLLKTTKAKQAYCVDPFYDAETEERVTGKDLVFVRRLKHVDDVDLYLFMDVLEHVDNDEGLLRQYLDRSEHGSYVFISVPAFECLWSGHDIFLEHRRRYTLHRLRHTVEGANLNVVREGYFFGAIFPIAAGMRLAQRLTGGKMRSATQLRRHSAPVNWVLRRLCAAEIPVMKLNKVAGLSVFCLARKGE